MKILSLILRIVAIAGAIGAGAAWWATNQVVGNLAREAAKGVELPNAENVIAQWKASGDMTAFTGAIKRQYTEKVDELDKEKENSRRLENQVKSANSELASQRAQNAELNNQLGDTRRLLATTQDEVKKLNSEKSALTTETADLRRQIVEIQSRVRDTIPREEHDKLQLEYSAVLDENGVIKGDLAAARAEIEELQKLIPKAGVGQEDRLLANSSVVDVNTSVGLIVLGSGQNAGLERNMTLFLQKDGRYIARVSIAEVQANSAIANILPGFGRPDSLSRQDSISLFVR